MGEMVKSFPSKGGEVTPSGRGEQGSETGTQVAGEAKQVASQVAEQAKDLVSQRVTERAGRSARDIDDVARALRETKGQLGDNVAAPYVDKVADQLERFSRFLHDAEPAEVVRDVERFARREPLLFLGGAFALGLVAARFLKSSARHEEAGEDMSRGEHGSSRREGQSRPGSHGARGSFEQRDMEEKWSENQGQRARSQGAPGHEGQVYSDVQPTASAPGQTSTGASRRAGTSRPEQPGTLPGASNPARARSGGVT